jgi:hypothetical protein
VPDPYKVDDEGNAVAEAEPAAAGDPATEAALRRQIKMTLRTMALSTVIGLIVIAVLAVVVPSIRGVMIFVFFIYLVTSLAARWYLRRKFLSQVKGPGSGVS